MAASKPMPVRGVDPWPHQVQAYEEAVHELTECGGGYGLLFDLGTGKTLTAVGIAGRLHEDFGVGRVLVMAPSSVLPEWRKALDRYAGFGYAVTECTGTAAQRHKRFAEAMAASAEGACSFAVVNYESAWRTEDAVLKFAP
ncbi:MAG: DEAD/DEAH box helicase family protein, partial [Candidatus Fimadaptatus sp.]